MKAWAWLLLAGTLILSVAADVRAGIRFWKDAKGVVHMENDSTQDGFFPLEKAGATVAPGQSSPKMGMKADSYGGRERRVRTIISQVKAHPRFLELVTIAQAYRKDHTYSMDDYFVCLDMALELTNMFKTRGFTALVVAGTVKKDLAGLTPEEVIQANDHAWVVVQLEPRLYAAIEATAGVVVDERIPHFDYYFQGLVFENPKDAKGMNPLIENGREACKAAAAMTEIWNRTQAGRPVTMKGAEEKGRLDAKIAECKGFADKYQEIVKTRYRSLY